MTSSWLFCVVVLLWFTTQLQIVLAGMREFSFPDVDYWLEESSRFSDKVMEPWHSSRGRLITVVKPGGASWFITPWLNLPNTSYLDMEASCNRRPCQFEIFGTNQSSAHVFKNYEFIQNLTFETRLINSTIIKKSYPNLYILARTPDAASETTFYIYSIKIRYYVCENTTIYNTDVSQIYSSTTNISQLVQCPDNALTSDGKSTNITVKCTPKGKWTFGDQRCVCQKGFYSSYQARCSRCPTDYYKTTIGDESCEKCPAGKTNDAMYTQCKCKKDHYIGADEDGQCYAVPSEVCNLNIQTVNGTSVNLTWNAPRDDVGFDGSTKYTVECYLCVNESKCDTMVENATFFPAKTNLATTSVIVSNLMFNKIYKFKVISMNNLKNVPSGKWKFIERLAVVWKTTQSNSETKCKCEEKASNSVVMFFAGAGTTLVIVLFIVIVIQIHKRRMNTSKESTNVHAVGTVEMQVHSPAETQATQSQTNQGYVSSIGDETTSYEEVSPPPVYTELNRNQQDATTVDNTYQKLIKHESRYDFPLHGELETSYEDVGNNKALSNYQELDSTKRVLDDGASYQKLTNFQRSPPV